MLVIDHPRTHTLDDIRPLFHLFISENSEIIAEWISIESQKNLSMESNLDKICDLSHEFIKNHADVKSSSGLVSAFADFRKIFWSEYVEPKL